MKLEILNDPLVKKRFSEKMNKYLVKGNVDECWGWSSSHRNLSGYPLQSIGGRSGYTERVSRIMLYLKTPITDPKLCALHQCDNPSCVNPHHLRWGTKKENTQDAIERGRLSKPPVLTREKTSRCYIQTEEDIQQLREWCEIYSNAEIAQKLGKKTNTAYMLLRRLGLKSKVNMKGVGCRPPRTPSRFESPELEKQLIDASKTMNVSQLARHFSVQRDTIYRQLGRLGISACSRSRK